MHVQDGEAKKKVFESKGLRVSNPLGGHSQTVPVKNSVFFKALPNSFNLSILFLRLVITLFEWLCREG